MARTRTSNGRAAPGLRWVRAGEPGIRRVRQGKGFRYVAGRGRAVKDEPTLARIRSLAIPPAWVEVWICADEHGHLQATGRDAKGRKQYRYHARFRAERDRTKFDRMRDFAAVLPRVRARVARDLRRRGLPRDKVVAAVVRLLDTTWMRVGNEEYARANRSHGLTTLRDRHVRRADSALRLAFPGKSGKRIDVTVDDPRLARIARRCRDLPGQELFQYEGDDGRPMPIGSSDVNAYLRSCARRSGGDVTAKDFRTWGASLCALRALAAGKACRSGSEKGARVRVAICAVAEQLGNTAAVCRAFYVHPAVIQAFEADRLAGFVRARRSRPSWLQSDEAALVSLLDAAAREQGFTRSMLERAVADVTRRRKRSMR